LDGLPPGVRPPEHRVDAYCASCGQFDRHPRHVVVVDMQRGMAVSRHFDCCHFAGCGDASCTQALAESGNAHGDDLTVFLEERQRRG
jgi:hypothetical protein